MRAIQITEFGGPEVLVVRDVPDPVPGPGQRLYDVTAAGLNYADTHQAENSYLAKQKLPLTPGAEFVGVDADGRRVVGLVDSGSYAQKVVAHDAMTWEIPEGVSDGAALSAVLQGVTAWHLLHTCAHVQSGETVVVHAAAGGVGTIAVQLAKAAGARVIASASTEEKRELALSLGADAAIDGDPGGLIRAVRKENGGKRVDIVLEMVGGETFDRSLETLAPFGRLVVFGMASRTPPTPVDPGALMGRSTAVIGFWLVHCMQDPQRWMRGPVQELLDLTASGALRPVIGGEYDLSGVAQAHRDLRSRASVGKLVLRP
ncbi:MAG: quinone oxidoreductase family protein [Jatrophihabitans sp.]